MMLPPGLDPTHLVTLHVLLEEGNVTRAAGRLGITQSSTSHRLAQLRLALGDPLFVRAGASLRPTPRALAMAQPLAEALRSLAAAVSPPTPFVPRTSRLRLDVAMPDLLVALAPRLVTSLAAEAPGLTVRLRTIDPDLVDRLAAETPSLALTPARFVDRDDLLARPLGELRFGVAGRRHHPALRRPLTVEKWLAAGHVVVRVGNEQTNVIETALAERGLVRTIGLEVPSFLAGLLVVARSDLLMNVPTPITNDAVEALDLKLREAPVKLPTLRFALAYHRRFHHDAAHRWARERVFEAVRPAFGPTK
jgi:DNA-binding transcriptional LysR family regulator